MTSNLSLPERDYSPFANDLSFAALNFSAYACDAKENRYSSLRCHTHLTDTSFA